MDRQSSLNRQEFLRLAGTGLAALFLPPPLLPTIDQSPDWPELTLADLPPQAARILARVPAAAIRPDGRLILSGPDGGQLGPAPLAPTRWNLESCAHYDRLLAGVPWGIVLHWYGDRPGFNRTLTRYLAGFNSLRPVDRETFNPYELFPVAVASKEKMPYPEGVSFSQLALEAAYSRQDPMEPEIYRTSAHFLVGPAVAQVEGKARDEAVGIVQTQAADTDGTPFRANHLAPLDMEEYLGLRQYYVRALDQLCRGAPENRSLLQDLYARPKIYPNHRTIAVEICGSYFDEPGCLPPEQQIANVVAVVWALMERYCIPASSVLGHHELSLDKADPGKKFLALVRYLIGAKALLEKNEAMRRLIFGQYFHHPADYQQAVLRYFRLHWNYLGAISSQRRVYEWEALTGYWFLQDRLSGENQSLGVAKAFCLPVEEASWSPNQVFLDPQNHEGVDLYRKIGPQAGKASLTTPVRLVAGGVCIFSGETACCGRGKALIFRHRQPDGAEILSVYSHLDQVGRIQVGEAYQIGDSIAAIETAAGRREGYLHFALAYGAVWASDLRAHPGRHAPASSSWILQRYLAPIEYLEERL